jgi:hypothetical protein
MGILFEVACTGENVGHRNFTEKCPYFLFNLL